MVKKWGPALLWMATIFILSNQPKDALPSFGLWDFLVKKGSHFLAYGLLAGLYWWALRDGKRPFATAFLLAFFYAVSDEWHQSFVPGRHATLMDVIIDSAGNLFVLGILYYGQWRRQLTRVKPHQAASES